MFKGGQPNPYDEVVAKTTDENLTSENWELILNLCDKVMDEGEQGARNVIAAVLKRLAHRNPNVQLYALALVEALSKNCGIQVHREIASRSFTQGLERLVTDRTAHDKVKKKSLSLIDMWTGEFENDPSLGIMEECYESLRGRGYKFEESQEPPPPQVDDEIRRQEEEELQRVLEMSVHDKGGRMAAYNSSYQKGGDPSGAGPSSSKFTSGSSRATDAASAEASSRYGGPEYAKQATSNVLLRTPSPHIQLPVAAAATPAVNRMPASTTSVSHTQTRTSSQASLPLSSVSRVRALHTFDGTEQGELTFEKGDIIKVVDRNYKDWWRGQLKGRTGIFPVNYVELLPDPTPDEIAREAEQEATVFSQAADIDKLLSMLRGLDPARDNLADNEEIQELYRTSMTLRPKIVKLIDKYSQKRAELISMNESFVKARTMFDRMMEDSLARHSGLYDARPSFQPVQQPRQEYRAPAYGPVYDQGYSGFPQPNTSYVSASPAPAPQQYGIPGPTYMAQQPPYSPPYPAQQPAGPYGPAQPPADPAAAYSPYPQPAAGQSQSRPQPQAQVAPHPYGQLQHQPQQAQQQIPDRVQSPVHQPPQQYTQGSIQGQVQQLPQQHIQGAPQQSPSQQGPPQQGPPQQAPQQGPPQQGPPRSPVQKQHSLNHMQGPVQSPIQQQHVQGPAQSPIQQHPHMQMHGLGQAPIQPQGQHNGYHEPTSAPQMQPEVQPQVQVQPQTPVQDSPVHQQVVTQGPPFGYDPNTGYADPNAQAWAQYYAQGGPVLTQEKE